MKKTLLIALILMVTSIAANAQNKQETAKVIPLTYKEFIDKVWDFEKNPKGFVYKGKQPAIIDFYATWCPPCKMTAPVLEKIAQDYDGKLVVYKVNVDEELVLASLFQVRSIPTLLFVPTQGQPETRTGAMKEAQFKSMISTYLIK